MEDFTEPQFYPERLDEPRKVKGKIIMTGAYCDMFGEWVSKEWIEAVLKVIRETPLNSYVLLTKNPDRYHEFDLPGNVYAGTTVEEPSVLPKAEKLLDLGVKTLLSIEPVLGSFEGVDLSRWDIVVVGYMIGRPRTLEDKLNLRSVRHENLYIITR